MFAGHVLMNPQEIKKAEARLHGNASAGIRRARVRNGCWVCKAKTAEERAGRAGTAHPLVVCEMPKEAEVLVAPPDCFFRRAVHKLHLVTAVADDEDGDAQ
jgi:hypothetical protein